MGQCFGKERKKKIRNCQTVNDDDDNDNDDDDDDESFSFKKADSRAFKKFFFFPKIFVMTFAASFL